jgi:uncharacterized protein (TIGR02145 family)
MKKHFNNILTKSTVALLFATMLLSCNNQKFKTVTIGDQVWMAENLNVDKFRNGDPIPHAQTDEEWQLAGENGQPAWCYYDNDPANGKIYGKLYNWYAVNDLRGLAPEGWHVATDDDWTILENYLIANGYNYDGTKDEDKIAKSLCAKTNWELSSEAGTPGAAPENNNSTGFTALPGGYRGSSGSYDGVGNNGSWWSAPESRAGNAWGRLLYYDTSSVYRNYGSKKGSYSVRCLRD